jgi:hypothetical protein
MRRSKTARARFRDCSQNAIITGQLHEMIGKLSIVLTLGGRLTTVMLMGGVDYVAMFEWRATGRELHPETWFRLLPEEAARRSSQLAQAQMRGSI